MNQYQKFLLNPKNKHVILKLIKKLNPSFEETYTSPYSGKKKQKIDEIRISGKYNWVCIKGKGISIGIEFPTSFCGKGRKLSEFEKEVKNNKFKVWRFSDDERFNCKYDFESSEVFKNDMHQLLIENKVPKPTAREMMNEYYSD